MTISEKAMAHFDRGLELADQDNWSEACEEFERAINVDPSVPYVDAERELAMAYASDKRPYETIIKQLFRVIELDPDDPGSWLWLASAAIAHKDETDEQLYYTNELGEQQVLEALIFDGFLRARDTLPKLKLDDTSPENLRKIEHAITGCLTSANILLALGAFYGEAEYVLEYVINSNLPEGYFDSLRDQAIEAKKKLHEVMVLNSVRKWVDGDQKVSEQALKHFHTGFMLFNEDDYRNAAGEFAQAIRTNASGSFLSAERMLAASYRNLAFESNAVADFDQAIRQHEKVVLQDPSDAGSLLWISILSNSLFAKYSSDLSEVMEYLGPERFKRYGKYLESETETKTKKAYLELDLNSPNRLMVRNSVEVAFKYAGFKSQNAGNDILELEEALFFYSFYSKVKDADMEDLDLSVDRKKEAERETVLLEEKVKDLRLEQKERREKREEQQRMENKQRLIKLLVSIVLLILVFAACRWLLL
jgi:tetratricopeptide (TPR) repeat protein